MAQPWAPKWPQLLQTFSWILWINHFILLSSYADGLLQIYGWHDMIMIWSHGIDKIKKNFAMPTALTLMLLSHMKHLLHCLFGRKLPTPFTLPYTVRLQTETANCIIKSIIQYFKSILLLFPNFSVTKECVQTTETSSNAARNTLIAFW